MSCARCGASDSMPCGMPDQCTRRTTEQMGGMSPHHEPSHQETMTQGSARQRACPMQLRDLARGTTGRCIGSGCMAWRWVPVPDDVQKRASQVSKHRALPMLGYCGLGGIPLEHLDERTDPLLAELRVFSHFAGRGQTLKS